MSFPIDNVDTSTANSCIVFTIKAASYSILFSYDLVKS